MRYNWYKALIKEIGIDLSYQAVVPVLGNPYGGQDGVDMVNNANPFNYEKSEPTAMQGHVTLDDLKILGVNAPNKKTNR